MLSEPVVLAQAIYYYVKCLHYVHDLLMSVATHGHYTFLLKVLR
jgi:hypothetical protein